MKSSEIVRQLAFLAYMLEDEEKITKIAELLSEVTVGSYYSSDRANLLNLLLYHPANETQRKLLITYMGNAETSSSDRAIEIVKKLTLQKEDFALMEDMLRFKRGKLKNQLLECDCISVQQLVSLMLNATASLFILNALKSKKIFLNLNCVKSICIQNIHSGLGNGIL